MNVNRILAVLHARNLEFVRDKSALSWNILFPTLIVFGFAFAFSGKSIDMYKIGVYGIPESQLQTDIPLLSFKYIKQVPVYNLKTAIRKVERHQLDMLIDIKNKNYWINNESPNGYILEKIFLSSRNQNNLNENTDELNPGYDKQQVEGREIRYVDWLLPGVLAMNIMFSALFGVGYVIVRYRKNGVLKRLKATPLTAIEFLCAQVLSRLWIVFIITIIVYLGSYFFLDIPMYGSYLNLFTIFVLGSVSMISIGLLIAARTASEELAGGILNLISWPMMFLSGVWFSLEGLNPVLQKIALLFPLTHLITGARAIMLDGASFIETLPYTITLLTMSLLMLIIGALSFRWN